MEDEAPQTLLEVTEKKAKKKKQNNPKIQDIRDHFLSTSEAKDLLYHDEEKRFYRFNPATFSYEPISTETLFRILDKFLIARYQTTQLSVTSKVVKEVFDSLQRDNSIKSIPEEANYRSSFKDGQVYDFKTNSIVPKGKEPTICFHHFDFDFPGQQPLPTPYFDKFIKETFTDSKGAEDQELQEFIISVMAYYLSPLFPQDPVAFVFQGSGANGKSVLLNILQSFIGEDKISSLSMEDLSDRFSPADLVGKRLNLVTEDQSKFIKVDKIKAMISLERIRVERKYEAGFFFKPKAKHVFSTNSDLKFDNVDFAVLRRIKAIPFFRTFVEQEHQSGDPVIDNIYVLPRTPNLYQHLKEEMPGIFQKLVARMKELHATDFKIPYPKALIETQKQIQESSSSALEFFHEYYEYDETQDIPIPSIDIYVQYENWYDAQNRPPKYKLQSKQFFSLLNKNFPGTLCDTMLWSQGQKKTSRTKIHIRPLKVKIAGIDPKPEPDTLVSPL